jgi:hypothetical protein
MPTITKHWLEELPTFSKGLFYGCIVYSVILSCVSFVLQFAFLTNALLSFGLRLFMYAYPYIAIVTEDDEINVTATLKLNEDALPI